MFLPLQVPLVQLQDCLSCDLASCATIEMKALVNDSEQFRLMTSRDNGVAGPGRKVSFVSHSSVKPPESFICPIGTKD